MAHHFILLRLNPFGFRVDREGWWCEHSVSWLRVCLSAEGTKNVSWPWLSPLRGWGSLTMASIGKFANLYIYMHSKEVRKSTHNNHRVIIVDLKSMSFFY